MALIKHKRLFEMLFKKTESGELKWKETSDRGSYLASFSEYSVEISMEQSPAHEESTAVRLNIRGADGRIIESIIDEDVGNLIIGSEARTAFYRLASGLYENVRRKVLGADKALDAILKELDDDIPF